MSATNSEENIKVIPFSGKMTEYSVWAVKFLARAKRRGYKDILKGSRQVPKKTDLEDSGVTEEQKKASEAKELTYNDLTLSIATSIPSGRVVFNLI